MSKLRITRPASVGALLPSAVPAANLKAPTSPARKPRRTNSTALFLGDPTGPVFLGEKGAEAIKARS